MERPHQFAGVNVPRAYVAGRTLRRSFLRPPAGNDQVLVDDRRRAEAVVALESLQDLRRIQIDHALLAERVVQFAGLRVERIELAVARSEDDLRGGLTIAAEVLDAAGGRIPRRQREDPFYENSSCCITDG